MSDHPQLTMFGGSSTATTTRQTTPRANRKAARASTQAALPLVSKRFLPIAGVPRTRAECPVTRPCPHIRCRHHLFLEEAETRAGRPGLKGVARNERGWTVSQPGDVGQERAGTTVNPRWLQIGGEPAELERVCPAYIWYDDNNEPWVFIDPTRWSMMRLRPEDRLDVINVIDNKSITWAHVANDNESIVFDEELPRFECMVFWIVRKRPIQSCALDVVDQLGKQTNEQTGFHLSRHRTLIARITKMAAQNGADKAEESGMERMDFYRTLLAMGGDK